ncbi:MAG TPA: DUF748 domain-containing protein [Syntrophales bacterium]|nr:DUF748 domain-containing protein [Syntrophales bacterium]
MGILKKILIGLAILIVVIGITGFFILPPIAKSVIIDKLSASLHREVTLEKISINPYALSVTIKGFTIKDPVESSPFLSFDELYVNAQGISSLIKRAVILKEIRLTRPYINISRHEDGSYNFSDLIPKQEEAKPAEETKPFNFSLNNIQIVSGSIDFWDGPKKTRHTVRDMHFAIPFISNIEYYINDYVEPRFSATINGNPYELAGKTKPFLASREMSFDVDIRDLDIPYYLNYVPVKMNFKLTSARLDVKMKVDFVMHTDKSPSIRLAGNVALNKVALDDTKDNKILRLPALTVALASVEPLIQDIHLSQVSIQAPELVVRRSKEGTLNLLTLVSHEKQERKEKKEKDVAQPEKKTEKKAAMKARIDEFKIDKADITFIDSSPAEPAKISVAPINLKVVNLSTEKGSTGNVDLSLTVDKKGEISIKGPLGIDPLHAELAVDVKNLNIRTFQSYFTDKIRINVTRGAVSTAGNLSLTQDSKEKPIVKYAGKISVSNLASIDKSHSNDFLNWKLLYFDQITAGYNPLFIHIRGISLTDFYARIIINPDGSLNVQNILGKEGEKEEQKAVKEAVPPKPAEKAAEAEKSDDITKNVKIGRVTLQGGTIDFADRFIKPNYSVQMLNIGGRISGLSSEEVSRATVDLKGNFGFGSPVEITGEINPLIKDLFADIKVSFKDIELSPVTPYSSKYIGYPILKGKLTFDISYLIDKRKLDAQNKVFIDQLTFGERVESPDAIKAPVTMAVALLTDRNGQINLDIPVSGSLDDPKFSVWPVIWQIIVNLITKAATAPFTLLASLIGGGEEMSFIEFDPGSVVVTEPNQQKIKSLVKALYERPNLKMDIEGYVDMEKDKDGIKKSEFDREVKAQKLKDMLSQGKPAVPVDQVQVQPQEYEKYLTMAYYAAEFPKPRNVIGIPKKLPPPEMEKLMITNIAVTDSDLRQLASQRTENVKELILESGQVAPGRVFIVEPPSLSPQKKEKAKNSRVDFKLK